MAKKASKRTIVVERAGQRLAIKTVTERVLQIIRNELTYNYVRQLRGREAILSGSKVEVIPTECFQIIVDPDKIIEPQVLTAAGYWRRLKQALTTAGYDLDFRDNNPHPNPDVYKPNWRALDRFQFRHKQMDVLQRIVNNSCGRICCPTGWGKSFIIGCLALLYPKARIVVATSGKDVIEQLYGDILPYSRSVGIRTSSKKILGRRIMCYSTKSLQHADFTEDIFLGDECHEFATQDNLDRTARFRWARMFGFSANTVGDRMDGADFELEGVFGPILLHVDYAEAVANGAVVPVKVRWIDCVLDENPAADAETPDARLRWGIWRNHDRNQFFADAVREYPDAQVLMVVDTLDHALHLRKHCPEFEVVHDPKSMTDERREQFVRWGLLNNDDPVMSIERRFNMKKAFEEGTLKKVIATSVWNRGVNFRKLQILARLDAKNSSIPDTQIPGRLSRLSEDKPYGLLIDSNDQFDNGFNQRARDRRGRYKKMGWEQIDPDRSQSTRYGQGRLFNG